MARQQASAADIRVERTIDICSRESSTKQLTQYYSHRPAGLKPRLLPKPGAGLARGRFAAQRRRQPRPKRGAVQATRRATLHAKDIFWALVVRVAVSESGVLTTSMCGCNAVLRGQRVELNRRAWLWILRVAVERFSFCLGLRQDSPCERFGFLGAHSPRGQAQTLTAIF